MAKTSFYSGSGTNSTDVAAIDSLKTAAETAKTAAETAQAAAETAEANAETSATNAASSATSGSTSASTATTKASEASTSASTATTKASEAAASASTATTRASEAATSESGASTSASTATTKASEASTSATNAATSETNAASSATSASTSASTATTKASEASTSASTATTKASEASTSATSASTSASTATTKASEASTSASTATTKASEASASATAAASSATSASSAQTAAESARDSALASFDSFDDRYLGAKSSEPSVDNDGNALVGGSLFFDTTASSMKVYTGSAWVSAYTSLSGALLVTNNLSDVNSAATSATNLGLGTGNTPTFAGATVNGNIAVTGTVDGRDIAADGTKLDGIEASADVTDATNVTAAGAVMDSELADVAAVKGINQALTTSSSPTFNGVNTTGDISFGDSDKATFGASDDLQIYHDSNNSTIRDGGTGVLILQSNQMNVQSSTGEQSAQFNENSDVKLYFDNSQKLATTSTGIDVTGNATFADNGKAIFGAGSDLEVYHNGTDSFIDEKGSGWLYIRANDMVLGKYTGETYFKGIADGATELYHNNSKKFETSSVGSKTDQLWGISDADTGIALGANGANIMQFYTGNSERMRLTADGKLGVGTSNPEALLDVAFNLPDDTNGVIRPLKLRTTDTANETNLLAGDGVGILFEIPDQSSSSIGASIDAVKESNTDDNTSTALSFKVSNNDETLDEAMRIDASGHAIIPAGVTLGTSTGVYAAANTLDAYEEGTWSGTLSVNGFSQSASSINYEVYTKVGNLVTIRAEISLSSAGYGSGYSLITGVPFAASHTSSLGAYTGGSISGGGDGGRIYLAGSNLYLFPASNTASAGWTTTWHLTATYFTS